MSTNHGMDENDINEIVSNDQGAHETAVWLASNAITEHGQDAAKSWDACKELGEQIRDSVIRPDAKRRGVHDRDSNLTECLFSRMLGCVDWAEVGRFYIGVAMEARTSR